jgi:hypothetical protein
VAVEAAWIAPPEGGAAADGAAVGFTEAAADETAIGSVGRTSRTGESAIADETAIGSVGRTSRAGESAIAEAGKGPSRQESMTCRPSGAVEATADAEGPPESVTPGLQRVIRALMGTSTPSGVSTDEPF